MGDPLRGVSILTLWEGEKGKSKQGVKKKGALLTTIRNL